MTAIAEKLRAEIRKGEKNVSEMKGMLLELEGEDAAPPEMPLPDFLAKRGEVNWLVGGQLGKGTLGFLVADSFTGKSCLAVQLMLSLSAGWNCLGMRIEKPARCLYAFGEGARELVRTRIEAAAKAIGCQVPPHFWVQAEHFRDFEIKRGGIARLIARTRPDFVCLDTLERVWHGEENSSTEWKRDVLAPLSSLIHEYGCSIMLIHHNTKESEIRKGWQKGRGTSAMYSDSDFWWRLETVEGAGNENTRLLYVDKNKFGVAGGPPVELTFDKPNAVFRWDRPTVKDPT